MGNHDSYFAEYASRYDAIQQVHIEMYDTYHSIALDFLPSTSEESPRILDLGCGTARFLEQAMMRLPNASAVAVDNSQEMLDVAAAKPGFNGRRVQFIQRDLTSGLPQDLGAFDLVCSFSAVHHLSDEHKARLFRQVREVLRPGGWFFLIDPMIETFDKDVFSTGRNREIRLRTERIAQSTIDEETIRHLEHVKKSLGADSPEKDRFGSLADYVKWMHEAGFKSVDHIWHFWMEHFFICRS